MGGGSTNVLGRSHADRSLIQSADLQGLFGTERQDLDIERVGRIHSFEAERVGLVYSTRAGSCHSRAIADILLDLGTGINNVRFRRPMPFTSHV